ncbi:hypothetical protein CgunFtcFv8_014761 [Champsocephalus gunnari]|uniref:Uncharacterized protein n=1 Tax=Champsocephalus gunnari TaxID=52237 RepID=A0AAN8HZR6_CHAGU|nr:hypothetical protein CgunFtcFv8_014761 [Champsocephalus gunnari]
MANQVANENKALKSQIRELQHQLEVLQLRSHFGIQRLAGSDEDIRFYTRFATYCTSISLPFGNWWSQQPTPRWCGSPTLPAARIPLNQQQRNFHP